ncbi:MAG: hypothetical protein A2V75_06150 [Actinobacteria bacterium RBG_16_70_17]|nr:MAG: hypothetical protein A2V75_06150 [Actinobacteria bacterium RBG_16_70_17]
MTAGALLGTGSATDDEATRLELLSDACLVEEFLEVRHRVACLEARSAALLGRIEQRGIPAVEGFGSTTGWLMARTGDPAPVCRSRVGVARALRHMPLTQKAFADGELSEPRVRLLTAAWEFSPDTFTRDESLLVDQARRLSARVFPLALTHWRRLADTDGALADAEQTFAQRRLHLSSTWAGMVRLDGDLDPESGALVMAAVGSLAYPAALDPEDGRSPQQRRADALVEICRRHLDSPDRPQVGGERPHLTVTVSVDQLAADGLTDLEGASISLEAVRRLACDAAITPIVTRHGQPIAAGRRTRVVPPSLRRALNHRDGGCTHPGCDTPPRWCDCHHITHWADGGATALPNLKLLCRRHHRLAHHHAAYPQRE